jgi:hypothetical protein
MDCDLGAIKTARAMAEALLDAQLPGRPSKRGGASAKK